MKGKTTSGIKGPADGAFSTTEALYGNLSDSVTVKCKKKKITKTLLSVFPSLLHTKEKHYYFYNIEVVIKHKATHLNVSIPKYKLQRDGSQLGSFKV